MKIFMCRGKMLETAAKILKFFLQCQDIYLTTIQNISRGTLAIFILELRAVEK